MITAPAATHTAIAYGYRWDSEFPLPRFQQTDISQGQADVHVRFGSATPDSRPFHFASGRLRFCADGLRYLADDGAILDLYGQDRIEVTPGSGWEGAPPPAFYGTLTAALLAARGHLPIHGSSVAIGDRSVLLCGHSGVGKSTLTAALLAAGAKLLSDDLSTVQAASPSDFLALFAGRRAVRLFPDVAGLLGEHVPVDLRRLEGEKKVLAFPPVADATKGYPLAAVLVLDADPALLASPEAAALVLLEYGYRRRAFRRFAGHARRVEMARSVSTSVPVLAFPRVEARDAVTLQRAAAEALLRCEAYLR